MTLDLILIAVLAFSALRGWRKGFIVTFIKFAAVLLPLIIAICFRTPITNWAIKLPIADKISENLTSGASKATNGLSDMPFFANAAENSISSLTYIIVQVLSMLAVFFLFSIICRIVANVLTNILNAAHLGGINKFAGFVLGLAKGYLYMYVIAMICLGLSAFITSIGNMTANSYLVHNLPNPLAIFYLFT